MMHTQRLSDLIELITTAREEPAKHPAVTQLIELRLPDIRTTAKPLEDIC